VRAVLVLSIQWALGKGKLSLRVAIIGADEAGLNLYQQFISVPETISMVGIFDDRMTRLSDKAAQLGVTISGRVEDLIAMARDGGVDTVVINLPWSGERRLRELIEILRTAAVEVQLCPDGLGFIVRNFPLFRHSVANTLGGVPLFTVVERPLDGWGWLIKRFEDNLLILLSLPITVPFCLLIAIAIKLGSKGAVLFRQERIGFNGKTFWVYKFRTMYENHGQVTGQVQQAERGDPRVTKIGAVLRRTSLDELPQLLNVLKGNMSIIGPRPHAVSHDEEFGRTVRQYYARHRVLPGMTGWAQVNGLRGGIEKPEDIKRRIDCDLYYIENWTILFDIKILVMTPLTLVHSNAY